MTSLSESVSSQKLSFLFAEAMGESSKSFSISEPETSRSIKDDDYNLKCNNDNLIAVGTFELSLCGIHSNYYLDSIVVRKSF